MKKLTYIEGIFHSGRGGIAVVSVTHEVLKLAIR